MAGASLLARAVGRAAARHNTLRCLARPWRAKAHPTLLTFLDFEGRWLISRRIDDRLSGRPGRFEGTASLVPDGAGLRYHEDGTLTLSAGPAFPATRDYLWLPDGEGIEVRFADGRPFH